MQLNLLPNWIFLLHALNQATEGSYVSICILVKWVWPSSHCKGCANCTEAELCCANSDSFSSAANARPDPFSKSKDEDNFVFVWRSFKIGVHLTADGKVFPMLPMLPPFLVICLHDSGTDVSPQSSEFTSCFSLEFGRKHCHDLFCGRGKARSKCVRNAASDLKKFAVPCLPKDRDALSANVLVMPDMDKVANGEARWSRCRMASAMTSRLAILDLVELSRLAQLTVGVLSDQAATCSCFRLGTNCSRTSQ